MPPLLRWLADPAQECAGSVTNYMLCCLQKKESGSFCPWNSWGLVPAADGIQSLIIFHCPLDGQQTNFFSGHFYILLEEHLIFVPGTISLAACDDSVMDRLLLSDHKIQH